MIYNIFIIGGYEVMKKFLIVVDMQKDFIDGSLGSPDAEAIVPAVLAAIKSRDPEDTE